MITFAPRRPPAFFAVIFLSSLVVVGLSEEP
jgi:hypothetical protein